jgi:hypothetical protein
MLLQRMAVAEPDSLMVLGRRIALASMAVILVLDIYWIRLCLQNLRPSAARA